MSEEKRNAVPEVSYGDQVRIRREKLAQLLNISPEQLSYITNAPAGCGLIRYGGALVPFISSMPQDTKLYSLLSTNPREVRWD